MPDKNESLSQCAGLAPFTSYSSAPEQLPRGLPSADRPTAVPELKEGWKRMLYTHKSVSMGGLERTFGPLERQEMYIDDMSLYT